MITNYEIPSRVIDAFTKAYAALHFGVKYNEASEDFENVTVEDALDLSEDFADVFKNWVEGRLT